MTNACYLPPEFGPAGEADIEPGALAQLELAMRLPIADRGALMPDAHQGYALPIGGVFRAHNSVRPAMVGVDIACRMMLTIFDLPPDELLQRRDELFATLKRVTTSYVVIGKGALQRCTVRRTARGGAARAPGRRTQSRWRMCAAFSPSATCSSKG